MRENKLYLMAGYFMLNSVVGQLRSTGAFEVLYKGQLISSKLESGMAPSVIDVYTTLVREYHLVPNPAAVSSYGLPFLPGAGLAGIKVDVLPPSSTAQEGGAHGRTGVGDDDEMPVPAHHEASQ